MKKIILLSIILTFAQLSVGAQTVDPSIWLKNATGIIEDTNGSVTRWKNQIPGQTASFGDATSATSTEGGEQVQESYPGKVNVAFVNNLAHLDINDSNAFIVDNEYSVFYVGKVGNVSKVAVMLGNFHADGAWNNCSGIRFTRKVNGDMTIQYGTRTKAYKQVVLSNLKNNEFFFFGFSVNSAGSYRYFDNSSPLVKTGMLTGGTTQNSDDVLMNLARQAPGDFTYDQTEVAEVSIFDNKLTAADFQSVFDRLSLDYKEIVKSEFIVDAVAPSSRVDVLTTDSISISFSQDVDITSELPKVFVNKSDVEYAGTWRLTQTNILTFTPNENWPYAALVKVKLSENLTSTDSTPLDIPKFNEYNFIVESKTNYGPAQKIEFDAIATVGFPQAGHKLPLYLTMPSDVTEKVPLHIWVHGGGWSGGNASTSFASYSPHHDYLAKNLGVATMGISYRCHGSNGNFSLAMEDVETAYQWAMANADTYNFDMTKVFVSGGSAGSPLGALFAQRHDNVIGFIGFNGIYDFVNDAGDFGTGNSYQQNVPSERANSAIYNLRTDLPATILMHGDADTTINLRQSTLFAQAINDVGGEAETVIYPGEVHAFFNLNQPAYEDVMFEMANFINSEIKKNETQNQENVNDAFISKMYPNPVEKGNILKIELQANFGNLKVQILNYSGQIVATFKSKLNNNSIEIETANFSKGVYLLKLSDSNFSSITRFIIE